MNISFLLTNHFAAACALFHTSSFQMLQTWLRTHHPTLIIRKTRHQSILDHLTSCLHHLLLVTSSIALLESHNFLAFLRSAYDYSKAVDTACLALVLYQALLLLMQQLLMLLEALTQATKYIRQQMKQNHLIIKRITEEKRRQREVERGYVS